MKLTIKRNQADQKGFFGGHKGVNFSLYSKADLTAEERALIERYKVGDQILADYVWHPRGGGEQVHVDITVNTLANGTTNTTDSITTLLNLEEAIKGGCQSLKNLLSVMSTFGGQEIIEI
jgi:hypothetical protein